MTSAVVTSPVHELFQMKSATHELKDKMSPEGREAGRWVRVFTTADVHPFDEIEWKHTNARIIDSEGKIVFEQSNIEVPAWWNQNTINVVASKFFRMTNGVKENSLRQVITRVCKVTRAWAQEQNYFESDGDAQIYEEELIYALLHQYGAFNSPVWFNLGLSDRKQAASACFISAVDDDLSSIMEFQKSEVDIFRAGSGSGANLSNLRSSYEKISAGSYTSGPLSWMCGTNAYAGAMKSGGATRNAAKIVVLDIDHPDILKTRDGRPGFIKCKAHAEQMAHDLIQAGYSVNYDDPNGAYKLVPYQNANHSVSIPDAFMTAVEEDKEWETRERLTGKVVHTHRARDIWKDIAEAAWFCGDPGVQFSDTLNKWHTTPAAGRIRSTNPCSEFAHVDNTACNLCAINLTKFFEGKNFLHERFDQSVRLFVTAQNAFIAKAEYPTKEITENSIKLRPIGLNYGDLGALLMNLGHGYDSNEGRAVAARLASLMTGTAYMVSAKLAARVGAFEEYERNRGAMLNIMHMHSDADARILEHFGLKNDPISEEIVEQSAELWADVIQLGEKFGYSVSQTTLQAPLGTISFMMGMNTTGVEPAFSLVSYKTLVGGGVMKMVNSGVRDALTNLGYSPKVVNDICNYVEIKDYIEGAPGLKPDHLPVFDCAMASGPSQRYITPLAHLQMLSAIQPLITCSISKTVNLPKETTAEEIASIYMEAWKLGVKCVALYRDGCKWSQPLATSKEKIEHKEESVTAVHEVQASTEVIINHRRHMPADVDGKRHRFEISGHKGYIQMNEYADKTLGEVFLKLGKSGSTMAGLIDGFTQLLSIALQYGVPLEKLIRSFVHTKFEPSGITRNPDIRFADSLFDYLFKLLDLRYYGGVHSGLAERKAYIESQNSGMSLPPDRDSEPAESKSSIDAPPCSNCGTLTQRNGTCHLCPSCGTTTGCS